MLLDFHERTIVLPSWDRGSWPAAGVLEEKDRARRMGSDCACDAGILTIATGKTWSGCKIALRAFPHLVLRLQGGRFELWALLQC